MDLGEIYMTPGVMEWVEKEPQKRLMQIHNALTRYTHLDWGNLDEEDLKANEVAIKHGMRTMGTYWMGAEEELWIITNGDRSGTTILWPREY